MMLRHLRGATTMSILFKSLVPVATLVYAVGFGGQLARAQGSSPLPLPNVGAASAPAALAPAPMNYGKLTFTKPGDTVTHHCTATFVEKNVLLTAAHCVEDLGTTTKFTMANFAREGGGNFAVKANCIFVLDIWEDQNIWKPPTVPSSSLPIDDEYYARRYDYAFLKTMTGITETPNDIHSGNPYSKFIAVSGYPDSAFKTIHGISEFDVLHQALLELRTIETDFREGTSGAAWIIQSSNKIVSINSAYAYGAYDPSYIKILGPHLQQ